MRKWKSPYLGGAGEGAGASKWSLSSLENSFMLCFKMFNIDYTINASTENMSI